MSTSRALANLLYTAAGALAGFHLAQRALQNLHPAPLPPLFARWLEHPWRLASLDPAATLDLYGLSAQMVVLDLGCGTGVFTRTAAQMVGPTGHVHAVDLQAPLLQQTRQTLAAAGLSERVQLHHQGASSLPLADGSIDLAIMVSTLGEIPDKVAALGELHRVLAPGARLGITEEWLNPACVLPATVRQLAGESGFQLLHSHQTALTHHQIFIHAP